MSRVARRETAEYPNQSRGNSVYRSGRNAVRWLNAHRDRVLGHTISSMPRRLQEVLDVNGAMTDY